LSSFYGATMWLDVQVHISHHLNTFKRMWIWMAMVQQKA